MREKPMAAARAQSQGHARRQAKTTPTAAAAAIVEWLLGKDQSPGGGHTPAIAEAGRPRQGRSSCTKLFTTSLTTYATTVPSGASSASAISSAPPSVRARHHTQTNNGTTRASP